MNFLFAVVLMACGVWVMTAAMKVHLDDVMAANELPREEYESKFWHTVILIMIGSLFVCAALILIVQIGVNL